MNILHYVTLRGVTNDCIVVPLQCIYRHNCANADKNFHLHLLVDRAVPILLHITAILIVNMTKALKCLASFCKVLIKIKQMPRGLLAILTKVEQVFIYVEFGCSFRWTGVFPWSENIAVQISSIPSFVFQRD